MAAYPSIDPARFLHEHLAEASPDLLRSLLTTMIDTLMSAEADAVCGAAHGERSEARVNHRNGYRHRDFDTRAGTLDVAIPKLRPGSYFPDWLLERRRAEAALTSVVATCYLLGVSTRRWSPDHERPGRPARQHRARRAPGRLAVAGHVRRPPRRGELGADRHRGPHHNRRRTDCLHRGHRPSGEHLIPVRGFAVLARLMDEEEATPDLSRHDAGSCTLARQPPEGYVADPEVD
jgi:hypothetical protein